MTNQPYNKGKGGAPKKTGLEYFPLYHDLYDDDKLADAQNLVDPTGMEMIRRMLVETIVLRFFSKIFKTGYFIHWSKDAEKEMCAFIGNGMNSLLLKPYLDAMLNSGLLDRGLFDRYSILTSRGIQRKWRQISIAIKRTSTTIDPLYALMTKESELLHEQTVINSRKNKHKSRNKRKNTSGASKKLGDQPPKNEIIHGETIVSTGDNSGIYPAETIVLYSSSSLSNISIGNKEEEVILDGKLTEETEVITGTNANNSAKDDEGIKSTGGNYGNIPEIPPEHTQIPTVINNVIIPKGNHDKYSLEICQWNYVFNRHYIKTQEAHQKVFGTKWTQDFIFRWLSAFHCELWGKAIEECTFSEYCNYFKNWVKIQDYKIVNPDILYTADDPKNKNYGNKRTQHGREPNKAHRGQATTGKAGGIPNQSHEQFFGRKRPATDSDLPQS